MRQCCLFHKRVRPEPFEKVVLIHQPPVIFHQHLQRVEDLRLQFHCPIGAHQLFLPRQQLEVRELIRNPDFLIHRSNPPKRAAILTAPQCPRSNFPQHFRQESSIYPQDFASALRLFCPCSCNLRSPKEIAPCSLASRAVSSVPSSPSRSSRPPLQSLLS